MKNLFLILLLFFIGNVYSQNNVCDIYYSPNLNNTNSDTIYVEIIDEDDLIERDLNSYENNHITLNLNYYNTADPWCYNYYSNNWRYRNFYHIHFTPYHYYDFYWYNHYWLNRSYFYFNWRFTHFYYGYYSNYWWFYNPYTHWVYWNQWNWRNVYTGGYLFAGNINNGSNFFYGPRTRPNYGGAFSNNAKNEQAPPRRYERPTKTIEEYTRSGRYNNSYYTRNHNINYRKHNPSDDVKIYRDKRNVNSTNNRVVRTPSSRVIRDNSSAQRSNNRNNGVTTQPQQRSSSNVRSQPQQRNTPSSSRTGGGTSRSGERRR